MKAMMIYYSRQHWNDGVTICKSMYVCGPWQGGFIEEVSSVSISCVLGSEIRDLEEHWGRRALELEPPRSSKVRWAQWMQTRRRVVAPERGEYSRQPAIE